MSISKRLKLLLRSEINALHQGTSSERSQAMKELKREFASLRKDEEAIILSIRRHRDQADLWEDRAALAVKRNEEELAKSALREQKQSLQQVAILRTELEEIREYLNKIGQTLEQFQKPKEEVRAPFGATSESNPLKKERFSRELRGALTEGLPSFGEKRAFSEFERIEGEINQFEASVEAERLLSQDLPPTYSFSPTPDPLLDPEGVRFEEEFRKIEQQREQKSIEDSLSKLKAKFMNWDDDE